MSKQRMTRRDFLKTAGVGIASAMASSSILAGCATPAAPTTAPATQAPAAVVPTAAKNMVTFTDVPKVKDINILINDSPWFPGFEKLVNLYVDKTGNKVNLATTPFTGMQEKTRNAVTAPESEFDIVNLNEGWYATFYAGKFMSNINDIDPDYVVDPNIISYSNATRWNHDINYSAPDGTLYGLPINGNIQLLYYRKDLLDGAGLKPPETWDDVAAVATKLMKKPELYGFSSRGQKAGFAVAYDWLAFLRSCNGDWVAKPGTDWTVTLADENGLRAIDLWTKLLWDYGPENVADVGQAELQQLMLSGKLTMAEMVVANWASMDNPEKSLVVDKVDVIPMPAATPGKHATTTGIWVMGVPVNLPDERKQAGLTFLKWALTKEAQLEYTKFGAVPVRQDVYTSELANDHKYRWMKAMADSTSYIIESIRIPEGPQVTEVLELTLNQIIAKQIEPHQGMTDCAKQVVDILTKAGYQSKLA
jgi:multiple sugar transport system substrate-binding protein